MFIDMQEDQPVSIYSNKVESNEPLIFTDIYQVKTNIAIWKRKLSQKFHQDCETYLEQTELFKASLIVTPENISTSLSDVLPNSIMKGHLLDDITQLVDMFCCLFNLEQVGLRLVTLEQAMCPRFHVDRVPCRLVTTYFGEATEWLNHQDVDRNKLGKVDYPVLDDQMNVIQQLKPGDVALLKGELWQDNLGYGLVHRSPSLKLNEKRLLLTMDFV